MERQRQGRLPLRPRVGPADARAGPAGRLGHHQRVDLGAGGHSRAGPVCAEQGGGRAMTRQLAVEYAARGFASTASARGRSIRRVLRRGMAMSGDPEAFLAMLIAGHPIGRIGRPEEIAAASRSSPPTTRASSPARSSRSTAATPLAEEEAGILFDLSGKPTVSGWPGRPACPNLADRAGTLAGARAGYDRPWFQGVQNASVNRSNLPDFFRESSRNLIQRRFGTGYNDAETGGRSDVNGRSTRSIAPGKDGTDGKAWIRPDSRIVASGPRSRRPRPRTRWPATRKSTRSRSAARAAGTSSRSMPRTGGSSSPGHPRHRRQPGHREGHRRDPRHPRRPRRRVRSRPEPGLHQQRRRLDRDGLRHEDAQDARQGQGQRPARHHLLRAGHPPGLHLQPRHQRHHGDRPRRDEGHRDAQAGRRSRAGRFRRERAMSSSTWKTRARSSSSTPGR